MCGKRWLDMGRGIARVGDVARWEDAKYLFQPKGFALPDVTSEKDRRSSRERLIYAESK